MLKRIVLGTLGVIVVLGVVIHLPPVMHWLGAHGHHGAGVCPLGYGQQQKHVATARPAGNRPALGFTLGGTTASQVQTWALAHGLTCSSIHRGTDLQCENVPASALGAAGPAATLWFELDDANVVHAIKGSRRGPAVDPIAHEFDVIEGQLTAARGAPTKREGAADPQVLASGALRQAMVEYRASDYRAVIRATNMGDGFVLTENYSLID